jgi:two-component system, oxyanion-binding sensor
MHLSDDHEPLGERGPELAAPARLRGRDIKTVRAGFIPLVDASVLIACAEFGFAEREGLTLDLVKDVSWANVRDRLAFRQFDVAHMLSPMPVASLLGLGSNPQPAIAPFSLGRGGNAITLSVALYRRMQRSGALRGDEDALSNAQALKHVIDEMRAAGEAMPVFAMTYPYSSHNYELRYWLAAGGIDPDRDVRLVVVPPPLTSDALAAGAIDGFCVGAPWNMVAVEKGVGRIVAVKQDIWASSPEKVIATRPEWAAANAETLSRLIVALDRAARWCDLPTNRLALAETLAAPRYLGASRDILERVLLGQFTIDPDGRERAIADYFVFHADDASYPFPSHALWIYSQMVRWGQAVPNAANRAAAAEAYRPDIYRAALGKDAAPARADLAVEGLGDGDGFIDGRAFDPADIGGYLASFAIRTAERSRQDEDDA